MRLLKKLIATSIIIVIASLATQIPVLPLLAASVPGTVSPQSGPPGTQVIVAGNGFTAGNTYSVTFTLSFTAITVAMGTVPASGSVTARFAIPVLPRGQYDVSIITPTNTTRLPLPTFTVTPQIFVDTTSGKVGDQVHVSGNGFNPNQPISIFLDTVSVISVTSDSQGALSATAITIPPSINGSHAIMAKDSSGASPGVNFVIAPKITLSANEGTVGSTVGVSGSGFASFESIVVIIDNLPASGIVTSDANGNFTNYSLKIPELSQGNHDIKAKGVFNDNISADVYFSVNPSISINPDNGAMGTKVTITGNGFSAVPNPIMITYNGVVITTNPELVTADASGNFLATFEIPFGAGNSGTVTASDSFSTISTTFSNLATISVNPLSGHVGTLITTIGTGFKENTAITISYDNAEAGTAITDAEGKFTTTFPVLDSATGTHQITTTDQVSIVKSAFAVIPEMEINPTSGSVGQDINIDGTGFKASSDITVKYDYNHVAKTTTDTKGTFVAVFQAPLSEDGNHQITVTDGSKTITSDFQVASTPPPLPLVPPPAPTLLSPPTSTKVSTMPTLTWEGITNSSGVTYSLQISKDPTFQIIALQKDGLKTLEYQLANREALGSASKGMPYYWRVKASDGANNQSDWTAPFIFYVGTIIPAWVYAVAIIALCMIVGGISYAIESVRRR